MAINALLVLSYKSSKNKIQKKSNDLNMFAVSTYAIKNTRRKMEDKHVCLQTFSSLYHLKVTHFLLC